jgi:general secretion pathway protein E
VNAAVDIFGKTRPASPELTEAMLADAVAAAAASGQQTLELLEQNSGLDPLGLARALAGLFGLQHVSPAELSHWQPAFDLLPGPEAARRGCAVVARPEGHMAVISDPFDPDVRPWLEARISQPLTWGLAAPAHLAAFIGYHQQSTRAMDTAVAAAQGESAADQGVENLSLNSISQDLNPIVKLVHSTIYDALRAGASDIHLESGTATLVIRYRIDGVLAQVATVNGTEVSEQVISRIKVMSELDIAERRIPQDGRFKIAIDGRPIDFRVSIMPSVFGEDAVLRILDKQAITDHLRALRLDALGFEPTIIGALRRLSSRPYGMLLVTGPTGSGKTTTLYASISETNTGHDKIVTIEDPVEYQLPGVLQIPVNEKKGLTFARGLRSILRHDPDKIMVGEIRDPETAQIAIQSALTGHLVFTTVHANNVFDVLSRFVHMGVDPYSFGSALNGILAQRLVRIVCEECAEPRTPPQELLEVSGIPAGERAAFDFRVGRGCARCRGTGYRGRRAIGELMVLDDQLREAIVARVPVRQLKLLATEGGLHFIRGAALDLVRQGLTTIEEVNRVTAMA